MTLLAGGAAFFVGNAYQAQMPGFALDLGHGDPGVSYSMLLAADAAGALAAGFVLESLGLLRPTARTALVLAMAWCCALASFGLAASYPLALGLLFIAGFVELSFNSMAQAIVQLNAPPAIRGRVIGVFSMAASGMRTFSGITVGMIGGADRHPCVAIAERGCAVCRARWVDGVPGTGACAGACGARVAGVTWRRDGRRTGRANGDAWRGDGRRVAGVRSVAGAQM